MARVVVPGGAGPPDDLTGPPLCPQVDLGHVYGDSLDRQYQLRLFKDGKLKYQVAVDMGMSFGKGCWELGWCSERASFRSWRCVREGETIDAGKGARPEMQTRNRNGPSGFLGDRFLGLDRR